MQNARARANAVHGIVVAGLITHTYNDTAFGSSDSAMRNRLVSIPMSAVSDGGGKRC